ncbi:MAG: DUF177 domain-containing protein [Legionella longbeachae]|nr:DUF177 domain-containing protein [Legionella longbeachae]
MQYLQEMIKQGLQTKIITLNERLPFFIISPCQLQVNYQVEAKDDFYLLDLHAKGELHIQCQRCLDEFNFPYNNSTEVAICRSDERAEQVQELYECIVSENLQLSIEEILIDELHLYVPQFHPNTNDCNSEINQILVG